MKGCKDCKRLLPLSEFHGDKSDRLGVKSRCKPCSSRRRKELYAAKAAYWEKQPLPRALVCRKCRQEKSPRLFVRSWGRRYNLHGACRACHNAAGIPWGERRRRQLRDAQRRARAKRQTYLPEPLVFPLDDEMISIAENLRGASVRVVAQTLRMMALRGIWVGYQRGMVSFCKDGPPVDAVRLVAEGPEQSSHITKPQGGHRIYAHALGGGGALERLQETEEDPLEAEADAVLRAG
jgi:hypothetical protein